jgi:hypothetical protein
MWANRFEELPMYFMTFFGQENIKKVIEVGTNLEIYAVKPSNSNMEFGTRFACPLIFPSM